VRALERHIYVGWKYGDQQRHQTPGGGAAQFRNQKAQAAGDFRDSAHVNQSQRRREKRRYDLRITLREQEVQDAGIYIEYGGRYEGDFAGIRRHAPL